MIYNGLVILGMSVLLFIIYILFWRHTCFLKLKISYRCFW